MPTYYAIYRPAARTVIDGIGSGSTQDEALAAATGAAATAAGVDRADLDGDALLSTRELHDHVARVGGDTSWHETDGVAYLEDEDQDRARAGYATLAEAAEAAERSAIESTLREYGGNVRAAARALDVGERTMWNRLEKLSIDPDSYRPARRIYTTRADAARAVRDAIYNVSTPATTDLVDLVTDRCWAQQLSPDESLEQLSAEGIDCEGFEG